MTTTTKNMMRLITHHKMPLRPKETPQGRQARAAKLLGAVKISPRRWAYYADETRTWWVVTPGKLGELCNFLASDEEKVANDAYSHWCASGGAREMPKGWTP